MRSNASHEKRDTTRLGNKSHPRNHKKALMYKHRGSFFIFLMIPLNADLDGFRGIFFAGYSPVRAYV
jgi:hypothetical protein